LYRAGVSVVRCTHVTTYITRKNWTTFCTFVLFNLFFFKLQNIMSRRLIQNCQLPDKISRHVSSYIPKSSRHFKIFIYLFHHTSRTCKDILRNAKGPRYSGWETLLQRFSLWIILREIFFLSLSVSESNAIIFDCHCTNELQSTFSLGSTYYMQY
jgi:hypothetical protein